MFGDECWNDDAPHYINYNHTPVSKFPESEMSYASPYNGTYGLSQIDGETIQTIYTSLDATVTSFVDATGQHVSTGEGTRIVRPSDISAWELGPWDDAVIRYGGAS